MPRDRQQGDRRVPWGLALQRYLLAGKKQRAMRLLDRLIEDDVPLFRDDMGIQQDRRVAWLYKIELLREWGRLPEALAWTCLECEMKPDSVAAQALKRRLKSELSLDWSQDRPGPTPVGRNRPPDLWPGVAGMRATKAVLERDIIMPLQEPAIYL